MSKYLDSIIAGFGGQGVMLIGNLLAYSGMNAGLNVTYIPVYGPEMRGGTANCTVVLSDDEIGSPIIRTPHSLIIMNRPSLDKFQPMLMDDGIQIVNSSLIDAELVDNERIKSYMVPCNDIADKLGNTRLANMVALGAFIKATGIMDIQAVIDSLENVISAHYHHLIPKNAEALKAGAEAI
ncbi:2-oxoacid:acceptor oxidoreductase family protein [Maridesulfovibrio sp.]|uniref:2-oxoacid:acceptor oxidoreductase family protein n=1 Tax=Maridesulfovibrio sp. TaxID=2795000 RepID=UPI002A18A85E|nr:2-oxoacid:acceptor oxidoreductase family protein [Maridesulfovibrio sp.]